MGFPESGVPFEDPYKNGCSNLGSILGVPFLGKLSNWCGICRICIWSLEILSYKSPARVGSGGLAKKSIRSWGA